jgi:hypothetical protein
MHRPPPILITHEDAGHAARLSEAPSEGAILAPHPFAPLSLLPIVSERSSPSRVRYAAPNNGAPLTAPVRSEQTLPLRGKELVLVSGPPRRHFGPFSDCHRQRDSSADTSQSVKN